MKEDGEKVKTNDELFQEAYDALESMLNFLNFLLFLYQSVHRTI